MKAIFRRTGWIEDVHDGVFSVRMDDVRMWFTLSEFTGLETQIVEGRRVEWVLWENGEERLFFVAEGNEGTVPSE